MATVESTLEGPWPLSRQDRDSCDEFRLLFANLPEPTWVYDVETLRILEVNRAAILKYGYSRQEFLSITIEGFRPPEDISRLRETLQAKHGTQSQAQPDAWRHRSKSGDVFEVEVASHRTVFAGREAQVVVARDIAARRQAERSLRLRYDLARLLSEGAGDALKNALRCLCEGFQFDAAELWSLSTDGTLCLSVQWNGTAPEAPDSDREGAVVTLEARSRLLADVWASGATRWITEPAHLAHWDCADFHYDSGVSSALVFAVRGYTEVNGVVVLLNRKPRQPDPPVADLLSVRLQLGQYISRRRTEAASLASENRFKLAQSVLAVGTWELDLATGRSTCSPQLLRVYGITEQREDFTGDEWIQLVHPEDRERILTELQVSVESGVAPDRHHRAIWPDGSVHWIVTKSHVMLDANGRPSRVIGMDFDETQQMRTEERLRFLSSAVEQSPVSIVITDLQGNIEYVNRKATEITGYSLAELVGHNPRMLKSGDKSPEEYRGIWETIRTGEWRGILHNKKKNGELFWESAAISPIRDSSGKPTHYLAVKEDITERMAIEAALKTSEERFRLITETISEVFWMSDAKLTRILYISPAYENLWGRSRESLYADPKSFMEPIHPEDRDRVRYAIESGMAAQQPLEYEYRLVLPDGSTRSIRDRGFPVYDSDGRVSGYVGVALNVTEQKASERANADLAAIVQSADSAIISKDLSGNVLTWNPGAERIFGYSAEEMIGRNISALIPADRMDEEAGIQATFLRGETTNHLETVRRTRSGNPISVLLTISPIRDDSGAVVGASQVAWNITEQKLLQRQLAQAQKLESIGQLAAGVAHEINTPIQYIGDNAKFLEEAFRDLARFVGPHREITETFRGSREPGLAAALDRIYQEVDVDYLLEEVPKATRQLSEGVEQVARIVRAMKEFSHPGPVEKVPLDINRAIESTIVVSKNEWKYVAELTTDFDLELPLVPSVAGEFNQVVLNLIVNAAHAIADVTKTTGGKGAIKISTRRSGEWAEVRVSDTGTGIPEAIRSNVFDPFFTTKEVGKGTGQGLSIAHAVIVKKHHGTFRFETEVGSGTTFILQLPLEARPAGETNSICL